jgi:DUF4097 and DUF4098 domain-containing protein YvlB
MTEHHFATPQPVHLTAEIGKGSVRIDATDTASTHVRIEGPDAEHVDVEQDGDQVRVIAPRVRTGFFGAERELDVTVTLPAGSDVDVRTGSAGITVTGTIARGRMRSGSGDVEVDTATGSLLVETGSGDVRIEEAAAELTVKSGSGDLLVVEAGGAVTVSTGSGGVQVWTARGPVTAKTGSGDVLVQETDADVSLTTGSGDLTVRTVRRGRVTIKGASGDVALGIPAGTPVWTDISTVSGDIRSGLRPAGKPEEGAAHVEVRARTVSGDVVLAEV